MAPPLLFLQDIRLTFGGTPLLEGTELAVGQGERLALVGRNGSGKSTLLRIAAGLVEPDKGTCFVQPGATVRYLPQEPDLSGFPDTLAYVEAGLAPGDDAYRARSLLEQLGLTGAEDPATLSGGEARRAAIARCLAPEPDILLLDEPTNHLDLPAIEWLESELAASRCALVTISHDRRFLERLSRATVWLDRGQTRRLDRGFGDFEAWRDEVLANEERDRHKLDRKIAMELDWVRYGVTARRKRNMGRMANLDALKQERRDHRRVQGDVKLAASEAQTSGKLVVEAKGVSKAWEGRTVVADFSMRILRGDRVAIVGPNGAGKTTLVNLLTGALAPDAGRVRLGANLEIAALDQKRAALDPQASLADILTDGAGEMLIVGGQQRHVASYLKDFLFAPEQLRTPVKSLSGGERGRLLLAKALAQPSNVLVLDEPTNDLDLETLDLLQEMVADYAGTVILVSHDRDFIDRTATAVLMAEGEGRFIEYAGGYADMVAQRGAGVAARTLAKPDRPAPASKSATMARAPDKSAPARKLTFKDKHALETLPARIDELGRLIAKVQDALADPGLYGRDPVRFGQMSGKLGELQRELAVSEERWLELEMLREEIEG